VSKSEPLNPIDAAWFRMDQAVNPADTLVLLRLETRLDLARLREVVTTRLLRHARFRQRVVESWLGLLRPSWVDDADFDLDRHVLESALDGPGEDRLRALLQRLCNQRLDLNRSPWRLWLIDTPEGGSLVFVQVHHCMGDGFALLHVLLSIADGDDEAPPRIPQKALRAPSPLRTVGRLVASVWSHLAALVRLLGLSFDGATPLSGNAAGERRIAWTSAVTVERIKALARARNATLNDVIVAAIAGALRRYILSQSAEIRRIRAIVPVNLRPASEPLELSRGNWFGVVFPELPIDAADAETRLERVKNEMDRIKRSKEPAVALAILNLLGRTPAWLGRAVDRLFSRKASTVISNVPGPREPLSIAGQRIADIAFWVAHPASLACGLSVISYAGSISVGVRTDAAVIAHPEQIAHEFDAELDAWDGPGTISARSRDTPR